MNVLNCRHETLVQKPICFVEHKRSQLGCLHAAVLVTQYVLETTRGPDQHVATFSLGFPEHCVFLRASHGCLNDNFGIPSQLFRLFSDLFGEFSSG